MTINLLLVVSMWLGISLALFICTFIFYGSSDFSVGK